MMSGAVVRTVFLGCGSHLPQRVVPNCELSESLDTTSEWIEQRTGIRQRHLAAEGELTSHLAIIAGRAALADAHMIPSDIDLVIVATSTPDETFPATATKVQAALGTSGGAAFDIQAVCAGFVYAVTVADSMLRSGAATTALVIGAETMTRLVDWTDRTSCVLFGDGAGAVVLGIEASTGSNDDRGVLASRLHSDGDLHDLLYVDGGPSSSGTTGHIRMLGREVYRQAVTKMCDVMVEVLDAAGVSVDEVDWIVPHQANQRIIGSIAEKLDISLDRFVVTVDRHGNTSAASIPLALSVAVADGRVQRGDLVLFGAIGGGMTWGANLVRW